MCHLHQLHVQAELTQVPDRVGEYRLGVVRVTELSRFQRRFERFFDDPISISFAHALDDRERL